MSPSAARAAAGRTAARDALRHHRLRARHGVQVPGKLVRPDRAEDGKNDHDDRKHRGRDRAPVASLTDIDQRITGRAYLFAILRDPRIAS
jgi:hypothetical protein